MEPLVHPRSKKDPAVSKDATGRTSCVCQLRVIACHTPILPRLDRATNWYPMKNRYSTATPSGNVPGERGDMMGIADKNSYSTATPSPTSGMENVRQ